MERAVDFEKLVRDAKALEAPVRSTFQRYAVAGSRDFMDILDLTSCLEELGLLRELRSEVVSFVIRALTAHDLTDASQDLDFERFKLIYNDARNDARLPPASPHRWTGPVKSSAPADALACEESEEEELVAARRQAKEQLADGIAIGMERVRMRNESLRAFVEKRFQSRHVDKTFVEAEYHLARRHASAQRRAQQGKLETYAVPLEPERVPMGCEDAFKALSEPQLKRMDMEMEKGAEAG